MAGYQMTRGFRVSRDALGKFRSKYTRGSAVGMSLDNPMVKTVVEGVEVAGTSFLFGFLHGRKGGMPETAKVPWDLGTAALMHVLGFAGIGAGVGGTEGETDAPWHMHNVGNGALAYYTGSMGAQIGQRMRKAAKNPDGTSQLTGVATPRTITMGSGPNFYGSQFPSQAQPAVHQWSPQQIAAMHRR